MRISTTMPAKNYTHFNSFKKSNQQNTKSQAYVHMDSKKLAMVSGTLALATITATAIHIMKKNKTTPLKEAKKIITNLKETIKDFNDPPIEKLLKGKRDAAAVEKYNQYVAQKKLDSLNRRLLDGEFSNKPQRVFDALRRNEIKLANKTGNASNFRH